MKKIAVFSGNAQYKLGGAESCIATMVELLQKHYKVVVVSGEKNVYSKYPKHYYGEIEIIKLFNAKFLNYFANFINYFRIYRHFRHNQYDLVIANCSTSIAAVNAVKDQNRSVIYYAHEEFSLNNRPEYSKPIGLKNKILRVVKRATDYPFFKFHCYQNSKALKRADVVIANSSFIANGLAVQEKIKPVIIYPFTPTLDKPVFPEDGKKFISMVGNSVVKGLETFRAIARLMPQQQFLVVGREFVEHTIDNITFRPLYEDALQLYRISHLVLVPSIWQEAFGKVSVEAACHAVPVIVSNRGGLPETVPDKKLIVADYQNAEAWKLVIEQVLSEKLLWGIKCQEFSTKFDANIDAISLIKTVKDVLHEK
uniref:glycosyltransferase family 4 protein n=1 Tax=Vibrio anguillarum TaxID=55601 RepID=UPI004048D0BF